MAKISTATDVSSRGASSVGVPSGVMNINAPQTGAIGAGVGALGDALGSIGAEVLAAKRESALTKFQVDAMRAIEDAEIEADQQGDPEAMLNVFQGRIGQFRQATNDGIADKAVRERANQMLDLMVAQRERGVKREAVSRLADTSRANLDEYLIAQRKRYVNSDAATRQQIEREVTDKIGALTGRARGVKGPGDAAMLRRVWTDETEIAVGEQIRADLIKTATGTLDARLEAKTPAEREALDMQMRVMLDDAVAQQAVDADKAEDTWNKYLAAATSDEFARDLRQDPQLVLARLSQDRGYLSKGGKALRGKLEEQAAEEVERRGLKAESLARAQQRGRYEAMADAQRHLFNSEAVNGAEIELARAAYDEARDAKAIGLEHHDALVRSLDNQWTDRNYRNFQALIHDAERGEAQLPNIAEVRQAVAEKRITGPMATTLEGQIIAAEASVRARRVTEAQVADAVQRGLPLDRTSKAQAALDVHADNVVLPQVQQDLGDGAAEPEIYREYIRRVGRTGMLPSQLVTELRGRLNNPKEIQTTIDAANAIRLEAPEAYDHYFTARERQLVEEYERLSAAGRPPEQIIEQARKNLEPENIRKADQMRRLEPDIRKAADAAFIELASSEWDLAIGDDNNQIDPAAFNSKVSPEIVEDFRNLVMNHMRDGRPAETAVGLASKELKRTVGLTGVFGPPRLERLAPETLYGRPGYGTDEMRADLAADFARDLRAGRMVLPEAPGEKPLAFDEIPKTRIVIGSASVGSMGAQVPMTSAEVDRAWKSTVGYWAQRRLRLVPSPVASVLTNQGPKPLYQPHFLDDEGVLHPIMQNVDGQVRPYLMAPVYEKGDTYAARQAEQQAQVQAAIRRQQERQRFLREFDGGPIMRRHISGP